eukprot:5749254-Pleurochrysis_carterae.AAC.13
MPSKMRAESFALRIQPLDFWRWEMSATTALSIPALQACETCGTYSCCTPCLRRADHGCCTPVLKMSSLDT